MIAIAIGGFSPWVELAWNCRAGHEVSEACEWGRAYLSLTRWLDLLIITPVVFLVLVAIAGIRRRDEPQ